MYYQDKVALEMLEKLEIQEYKRFKIAQTEGDYYCPWLSLYPNTEIKLSLIINIYSERTDTTRDLELDFDQKEFFEIKLSNADQIKKLSKTEHGKPHVLPDTLLINCIKPIDNDTIINIRIKNSPVVVGKLQVYANSPTQQRIANIIPIRLITSLESNQSNLSSVIADVNNFLTQAMVQIADLKEIMEGKNFLDLNLYNDKDEYGNYLFRIDNSTPITTEDPNDRYVVVEEREDDNEHIITGLILQVRKENMRKEYGKKDLYAGRLLKDREDLIDYLNRRVKKEMEAYGIDADRYVKIYFADQPITTKFVIFDGTKESYTESNPEKRVSLSQLSGVYIAGKRALISEADSQVLTHELLHAIGVEHSFTNKVIERDNYIHSPGAMYTYQACKTDNIMDYSNTGNSTINYLYAGDKIIHYDTDKAKWLSEVEQSGYYMVANNTAKANIPQYTTWHWQWKLCKDKILPDGTITHAIQDTSN